MATHIGCLSTSSVQACHLHLTSSHWLNVPLMVGTRDVFRANITQEHVT